MAVSYFAPKIIAQSNACQNNPDNAGPGIELDADVRSKDSGRYELDYHDAKAAYKGNYICFP